MGKRRAVIISFSLILVLGVVALFFIKNVKYADPQPAIKFGQRFYESLAINNVKDAFALYSPNFQNTQAEKWENF